MNLISTTDWWDLDVKFFSSVLYENLEIAVVDDDDDLILLSIM
jgi:hypothetical protein